MATKARHHHYIPQCYLKGFTKGTTKNSSLIVGDLKEGRFFQTTPRNIAGERDFNRIDVEGQKPNSLEQALGKIEGKVDNALKSVQESLRFEGEEQIMILNFIALLAVRSPERREHFREFKERRYKRQLGILLQEKERWEVRINALKKKGEKVPEEVTYKKMKEFRERDEYRIDVSRESHIKREFELMDTILRCLALRHWMLFMATPEAGQFISSDNPVVLEWKGGEDIPPFWEESPGFGMSNTRVLFPISQNTLLVGEFDGQEGTFDANNEFVAHINYFILGQAFRQIYTCKSRFPYIGADGKVHHDERIFERLKN